MSPRSPAGRIRPEFADCQTATARGAAGGWFVWAEPFGGRGTLGRRPAPTRTQRPGSRGAAARQPFTRESRLGAFQSLLAQRILVLDGAMGTMIQSYTLT